MQLTVEQLKTLFEPGSFIDTRKRNLVAKCPQCGEMEFGISLANDHLFGCYREKKCGFRGNIYTLLKYLGRTDFYVYTRHDSLDKVRAELEAESGEELCLDIESVKFPVGWKRTYNHEYLNSRSFTPEDYEQYEVGVSIIDPRYGKNYVIFAVRESGELKGYVGRSIFSKVRIDKYNAKAKKQELPLIKRYVNSKTDFSKLAYGIDDIIVGETKTLILVEGIFDKKNVDKHLQLHLDNSLKCNATFKCNCSPEQIYKWIEKGIEKVILLYDPDVIKKIKSVGDTLQQYFEVEVGDVSIVDRSYYDEQGVFVKEQGDVGDATFEEIVQIFSNLSSVDNFGVNKVNVKKLEL